MILKNLYYKFHFLLNKKTNWNEKNVGIIVSTGRTGTEFFAKFISKKTDTIVAKHEPQDDLFNLNISFLSNQMSSYTALMSLAYKRADIRKELAEKSIYIESNNNLSGLLPIAYRLFPKVNTVFIVRDGIDFVISEYSKYTLVNGDKRFVFSDQDVRVRPNSDMFPENHFYGKWSNMDRFERACWYWNYINERIASTINLDSLTVKFEDLFAGQQSVDNINSVLEFLGVISHDVTIDDIKSEKTNHTKEFLIGTYDTWTTNQKAVFNKHCSPMMKKFGYIIPNE